MPPVLRFLACLALALSAASPSIAVELPQGLVPGGAGRVVEVIDGDTVILEDGREVRLVGIQAPKLPLGRAGYPTWPLAPEAKTALERLALAQEVTLGFGGREVDRNGRMLAHLFREPDALWLQGAMLEKGLARVYTFPDNRAMAEALFARERAARDARRGLWALDSYAVLAPDAALAAVDQYALIEGRVLAVGSGRGSVYLNFGPDWKTDFTAVIHTEALRVFTSEGIDLDAYEGRQVRVRGWVESWNGPSIEITHPEQIEEVDE
jgi:endonuclease YncB( thermonuclease family)